MAHPYHHALSSVKKWGGVPEDYEPIHAWFDDVKSHFADFRHRAMRHHSEGIFMAEHFFGKTITNSDGRVVPVRFVGEQHVTEDCGWIPTVADWLKNIQAEPWMKRVGKKLAHTLEIEKDDEPRTITENAVRQSQEVEVG
jgi:hypothetical protein